MKHSIRVDREGDALYRVSELSEGEATLTLAFIEPLRTKGQEGRWCLCPDGSLTQEEMVLCWHALRIVNVASGQRTEGFDVIQRTDGVICMRWQSEPAATLLAVPPVYPFTPPRIAVTPLPTTPVPTEGAFTRDLEPGERFRGGIAAHGTVEVQRFGKERQR